MTKKLNIKSDIDKNTLLTNNNGRRSRLINVRNKCLIARYYYWTEIKRIRFDDVLTILQENEFFIKDRSIMNIINDNTSYYKDLIDNNISKKQLKKEFPAFMWN